VLLKFSVKLVKINGDVLLYFYSW